MCMLETILPVRYRFKLVHGKRAMKDGDPDNGDSGDVPKRVGTSSERRQNAAIKKTDAVRRNKEARRRASVANVVKET